MESLRLNLNAVTLSSDHVRIFVDNKELRCSKQLLVQQSKYFEAYFAFSPAEDHHVVKLKGGIDYESIKTILDGLAHDPKGIEYLLISNWHVCGG